MNFPKIDADKLNKILGGFAALSVATYLYRSSKSKQIPMNNVLGGIIEIRTDKLIDKGKEYLSNNPHAREMMANALKGVLGGLMNPRNEE